MRYFGIHSLKTFLGVAIILYANAIPINKDPIKLAVSDNDMELNLNIDLNLKIRNNNGPQSAEDIRNNTIPTVSQSTSSKTTTVTKNIVPSNLPKNVCEYFFKNQYL